MSSYYDLLGVVPNATEIEIRSAYGRDVLRLNAEPNQNTARFRTLLDEAFATLTDPTKRAAYDFELATPRQSTAEAPSENSEKAFRDARNGGIAFAAGGLITAASYAFSDGTYFLAWGPLLFGGIALAVGLLRYLRVPSGARQGTHLAVLVGLIAVGILSAGFVAANEGLAAVELSQQQKWNAMIDSTANAVDEASKLVAGVFDRTGTWTEQDSAEMARASTLYGQLADTMARTPVPNRLEWYRDGMTRNLRQASEIARDYSRLTASASTTAVADLDRRWRVRIDELKQLSARFDAQEGTGPYR